MKINDNKRDN